MDIGGEETPDEQTVLDRIATRGIRLRRRTRDGVMQEIYVFASTPRQENMAILNREAEQRLRERFASRN